MLALWGGQLFATPACPIITQSFSGAVNGATVDNSSTGWFIDASKLTNPTYFAIKSNRFKAENIGAEGIWYSRVFSTTGVSSFQVAVKISSEGLQTSSEYVKVYYKINGGAETLLDQRTGNFGTIDFTSPVLTGNNVQLIVKMYNFNNGSSQTSKYYVEQYRVFKESAPCSVASIGVTATAGNGGVLTCANPSLTLSASTSASGTTTYSWTGPGSFTSTAQNPSVNTAGTYTVVGTNTAGSGSATVTVTDNRTAPDLTATGAALGCATSATINASSSVSGATYSWTGPNSFTSTSQNPSVSAAGTYTVTVTNPANGCTASQTVTVTAGTATATTLWLEDFSGLSNGTISDAGATAWSISNPGPSGSTFSVQNNEFKASFNEINNNSNEGVWTSAVISITGKTNVVISANLRSDVASGKSFETDDYIRVYYKLNGGAETIFYDDPAGIGSSTTGTSSTSISSPSLSGSTLQIVIRARNSDTSERYFWDNVKVVGASPSGAATVTPSVTGNVTCTSTAQLSATLSSGTATAWAWTGPNGFSSALQNPTVNAGGQYTVTATLSGGCTVSSSPITISENKTAPDIVATGGVVTCSNTSVTLSGVSATSGITYSWSGPNSFSSTSQNPTASAAGVYTLTVTNPSNGCSASDTANVFLNNTGLTVTASANIALTCKDSIATLTGTSSGTGITYSWTGPNSFTSALQNPTTKVAGIYTLVATNPATGCSGTDTALVASNKTLPVVTASAVGQFACNNPLISLSGSFTPSSGVSFGWTGPNGFTSAVSNPAITSPGIYTLTVTNTSTGCVGSDTANAILNNTPPGASAIPSGSLNCRDTVVTLTGNSPTAGASYSWTGPNGFTSGVQSPTVKAGGNYTLTVTSPVNGCTSTTGVIVNQDTTHPANVTAAIISTNKTINCLFNNVFMQGNTPGTGFNYGWTLPNGTFISANSASAFSPGVYTYTVTSTSNFCATSVPITVIQDVAPPLFTVSPLGAFLSCASPSATFTASSSVPGVTYAWTGPNGITSSTASVNVTAGGAYSVTLTNPANGCTNNTTLTAIQNTTPPSNVVASTTSGVTALTCTNSSLTLSGTSSSTGITFRWTGPNGFTASTAQANASAAGTYTLVATNPSTGCSASSSIVLSQNNAAPIGVASIPTPVSALISCTNSSVTLNGTSGTSNVSYNWSGPNGYSSTSSSASATSAGDYVLTVTDNNNGCKATATTTVTKNTNAPVGLTVTVDQQLTCSVKTVNISGGSTTPGVTYSWTGPNGFTAATAATHATVGGTYTLHVMNPTNGCSQTLPLAVNQNITPPGDVNATNSGPLTCDIVEVTLNGTTSSTNVGFEWDGPNGYQSFSAQDVASDPGDYVLTVTNFDNGCTKMDTTTVVNNCGARKMTTPAAASAGTAAATEFEWKAYPNPFNNKATVTFKSPESTFVTVRLFNSTGILEKVLFNEKANAGQLYTLPFTGRFPAGMHYIVMTVNNKIYTKQLISVQ